MLIHFVLLFNSESYLTTPFGVLQPVDVGSLDGGAKRDRTADLLLARQALSQLSYGPGKKDKLLQN